MKERLVNLELLLKVSRELASVSLLIGIAWIGLPLLVSLQDELQADFRVDKVSVLGIDFVRRAQETTAVAIESAKRLAEADAPKTGVEDQVPPQTRQLLLELERLKSQLADAARIAPAASGVRPPASTTDPAAPATVDPPTQSTAPSKGDQSEVAWVYLGALRDGRWLTKYFDFGAAVPPPDTVIRATSSIYKRSSEPKHAQATGWTMGAATGVLNAGDPVAVAQTVSIPGTEGRALWWAKVRRVS